LLLLPRLNEEQGKRLLQKVSPDGHIPQRTIPKPYQPLINLQPDSHLLPCMLFVETREKHTHGLFC
jgi:hypothetical protein